MSWFRKVKKHVRLMNESLSEVSGEYSKYWDDEAKRLIREGKEIRAFPIWLGKKLVDIGAPKSLMDMATSMIPFGIASGLAGKSAVKLGLGRLKSVQNARKAISDAKNAMQYVMPQEKYIRKAAKAGEIRVVGKGSGRSIDGRILYPSPSAGTRLTARSAALVGAAAQAALWTKAGLKKEIKTPHPVVPARGRQTGIPGRSSPAAKFKSPRLINTPGISKVHTVKSGETLSRIARKYGTTTNRLMKLNPGLASRSITTRAGRTLAGADLIFPNDRLKLPATGRSRHGDIYISNRYQVPTGAIDPYPKLPGNLPVSQRGEWRRQYYKLNPAAAAIARSDFRAIRGAFDKHIL